MTKLALNIEVINICNSWRGRWEVKLLCKTVGILCLWLVCWGSGIYIGLYQAWATAVTRQESAEVDIVDSARCWAVQQVSSKTLFNNNMQKIGIVKLVRGNFYISRITGSLYCQRPDTLTSPLSSSSTSSWNSSCLSLLFVSSCALSLGRGRGVSKGKDPGTTTGVNLDKEDNSSSEASATTIPATTTEIITTETTTIEDQSRVVDVQEEMHQTTSFRWNKFWKVVI